MMAAMFIRYGVLRLLGLSAKTLVIDEVHAYDTYMQNILEGLLSWCRALEIPVVLLSATLPPGEKAAVAAYLYPDAVPHAYPAISAVTDTGKLQIVPVTMWQCTKNMRWSYFPSYISQMQSPRQPRKKLPMAAVCACCSTPFPRRKIPFPPYAKAGFSGTLLLFHARFFSRAAGGNRKAMCVSLRERQNPSGHPRPSWWQRRWSSNLWMWTLIFF